MDAKDEMRKACAKHLSCSRPCTPWERNVFAGGAAWAFERAAKIAEEIFDSGNHGAHAGEQSLRTAAAIRKLAKEYK